MKATHQPPTIDHDTAVTPADLLRGAAVYLQRHGWTKGQFFELLADNDGPFLPACASGAIMTAAHGQCVPNGIIRYDETTDPNAAAAAHAMRIFANWLDNDYLPDSIEVLPVSYLDVIGDWNDDKGRTLDEVLQALNDAADNWDRAHPTGEVR
jgi:hypothetical protein